MTRKYHNGNSTMVRNVNGTSATRYVVSSLSKKYYSAGGTTSTSCQAKACGKIAAATAHVIHADHRHSREWQLTRLCAAHNSSAHTVDIALRSNANLIALSAVTKK